MVLIQVGTKLIFRQKARSYSEEWTRREPEEGRIIKKTVEAHLSIPSFERRCKYVGDDL